MNSLDLLNDYEQFTQFFQSLETFEDCLQHVDLEEILDSLETEGQE